MRRVKLTKSIGTKVTAADYHTLVKAAGDDTVSDWLRDVALLVARSPRGSQLELLRGEILALRRILLNVVAWSVSGKTITEEALAALIAESDAKKLDLARARAEA